MGKNGNFPESKGREGHVKEKSNFQYAETWKTIQCLIVQWMRKWMNKNEIIRQQNKYYAMFYTLYNYTCYTLFKNSLMKRYRWDQRFKEYYQNLTSIVLAKWKQKKIKGFIYKDITIKHISKCPWNLPIPWWLNQYSHTWKLLKLSSLYSSHGIGYLSEKC